MNMATLDTVWEGKHVWLVREAGGSYYAGHGENAYVRASSYITAKGSTRLSHSEVVGFVRRACRIAGVTYDTEGHGRKYIEARIAEAKRDLYESTVQLLKAEEEKRQADAVRAEEERQRRERLYAAAPDLLEALKELLAHEGERDDRNGAGLELDSSELEAAKAKARAAIEKAEGVQA
jgi:hypothetical protein